MADRDTTRAPREAEAREKDTRTRQAREYVPPSLLPDPHPQAGWRFKWVRTSMVGNADNMNVSRKLRTGYVPVLASEVPEVAIESDRDSRYSEDGNIVVGGLMLCKIPEETAQSREQYYARKSGDQMTAVDRNMMRVSDPRMPMNAPERRSSTKFGSGATSG